MKGGKNLRFVGRGGFFCISFLLALALFLLFNIETKAQTAAMATGDINIENLPLDKTKEFIKSRLEDYSEDINTHNSFGTAKKVFDDDQVIEFRHKLVQAGYHNRDLDIFKPEECSIWLAYNINTSVLAGTSIRLTRIPFADLVIQNAEAVKKEVRIDTLYGKRSVVEYAFPSVGDYWMTKNSSAYISITHPKIGREIARAFNHAANLCRKQQPNEIY
jgi:hypothetical protein